MAGRFSLQAIFEARDRMRGVLVGMGTNVRRFVGSAKASFGELDRANMRLLGGLKTTVTTLGVIGAGAGAGLHFAAQAGMNFEEAITAVGAVSLMSRDKIADLEKEAIRLGSTTKFSATEVANAMEMMGRAGFTNAETLQGVGGVLSAAAAEGAELAETASHISNVLKGMGLATSESGRVADVLTLASARTNSSISSLGESMKNVASTARQLGVPLEDTVAMVALLQDVGLDASEAGSSLATMLTMMANPAAEMKKKMGDLGVSFEDAAGNMKSPAAVLGELVKAGEGLGGNMEQVAFFADLVGMRGQKAANNLKDLFKGGKVTELVTGLQGAKGKAEEMANLRLQNLKGDFEQLGGAIEGVQISLFNMESEGLRAVVQGMTNWIGENERFIRIGLIETIEKGTFAIDVFTTGVKEGFGATKDAIEMVVGPLGEVAELFDGGSTWPENVRLLGRAAGVAAPVFVGYTVAVKGAALATGTLELVTNSGKLATVAATGASYAYSGALAFATLATKRLTFATMVGTAWEGRKTVAVIAGRVWTLASRGAELLLAGARGAVTTATIAYAVARGRLTLIETAGAASAAAANAALLPLLVTVGALAAAVGSLVLAWKQWEDLKQAAGGIDGISAGWDSFKRGEGFFKGVDEHMNRQARERFAAEQGKGPAPVVPPEVPSPTEAITRTITETKTEHLEKQEVTLKLPQGVTAEVKKPKAGKTPVKVQPTGAT